MEVTENHLISLATHGDREALATLLRRHDPAVRQCLAGRIPRRWQSVLSEDDVIQLRLADKEIKSFAENVIKTNLHLVQGYKNR